MKRPRYAVICPTDGRVALTRDQYIAMLDDMDRPWRCPKCGGVAEWDDDAGETNR